MKISTTQERLKHVMKKKGLRQVDVINMAQPFCKKYGVKLTKTDLSQYISGKTEPNQSKLLILAITLNVNEAWLMGYDIQSFDPYDYNSDPEKRISSIPEHIRQELQEKYPGNPQLQFNDYWDQSFDALSELNRLKQDYPDLFSEAPSNIIPLPKTRLVPMLGTIACGEPILAEENIEAYVSVNKDIPADFALKCKGDSMINARIFDGDIVYIRRQSDVDDGEIAAVLIDTEATLKRVRKLPNKLILSPCNPMYDDLIYTAEQLDSVRILGKAVAFTSTIR